MNAKELSKRLLDELDDLRARFITESDDDAEYPRVITALKDIEAAIKKLGRMLIILDLDGTLTPQRPSSTAPFEHRLLPAVREKCAELRGEGHTLAIATNQGGLRKGLEPSQVFGTLDWLVGTLGIGTYRVADGRDPERKKPAPGMLMELIEYYNSAPDQTVFVGDAETDRLAAEAAGCGFEWASEFFI